MAKGKKRGPRTVKKSENTELTVTSQTETKENKPANKDSAVKTPSILQTLQSPKKPRSPLGDNSSMLIQEGNGSEATSSDSSKPKKDIPSKVKSESCEQKSEVPCQSREETKQASDQPKQKETTKPSNAKSATAAKVSAPKTQTKSGRKTRARKVENKGLQNRKVTDYFPIRRSNRKTKTEIKSEEHKYIDDLIKNDTEEGMQVKHIEGKGRGVFAVEAFKKGDFVVEYHGDLLDLTEAKKREDEYAKDPETGCYMYYFQYQSKTYCVDATKETDRLGRLLNHSKSGNCQTRLHAIDGKPHLILVASRNIESEEELLYDYGDRSKDSISAHPWLKY